MPLSVCSPGPKTYVYPTSNPSGVIFEGDKCDHECPTIEGVPTFDEAKSHLRVSTEGLCSAGRHECGERCFHIEEESSDAPVDDTAAMLVPRCTSCTTCDPSLDDTTAGNKKFNSC